MTDDTDRYFYEPSQGHGLPHDPFNAIVGPRPIGWVSTKGKNGSVNLAPYSFFNAFNYTPPIIGFSRSTGKDGGGDKDSLRNARETSRYLLKEGIFDTFGAGVVLRAGGPSAYAAITPESRFDMRRPK